MMCSINAGSECALLFFGLLLSVTVFSRIMFMTVCYHICCALRRSHALERALRFSNVLCRSRELWDMVSGGNDGPAAGDDVSRQGRGDC